MMKRSNVDDYCEEGEEDEEYDQYDDAIAENEFINNMKNDWKNKYENDPRLKHPNCVYVGLVILYGSKSNVSDNSSLLACIKAGSTSSVNGTVYDRMLGSFSELGAVWIVPILVLHGNNVKYIESEFCEYLEDYKLNIKCRKGAGYVKPRELFIADENDDVTNMVCDTFEKNDSGMEILLDKRIFSWSDLMEIPCNKIERYFNTNHEGDEVLLAQDVSDGLPHKCEKSKRRKLNNNSFDFSSNNSHYEKSN
jgi:hypothetical protein